MPCSGKASLRGQLTKRPINWRVADAAKLIELAAKLAQLAAYLKDAPGSDQAQDSAGRVAIYLLDNGRDSHAGVTFSMRQLRRHLFCMRRTTA